ncbi:hypothetical protein WJX75_001101 [Coccomyxa subellipsoidea]|uniref:Receptor L-domain domain-containing protein n=1 Tax=Coccomyxa subellipsoidea TaxID=248742 RepID=A0ABR2YC42_9CHLO
MGVTVVNDVSITGNIGAKPLSLSGALPALTSSGTLTVQSNTALQTMDAFAQSLQYLYSLNINSNSKLTTLAGAFKALQLMDDALLIQSNALLTNLTGAFGGLSTVRGAVAIDGNAALPALSGGSFGSLMTVGQSLELSNNGNLASITGAFQSLTSVGGGLSILAQTKLAALSNSFTALSVINGRLVLSNNAMLTSMQAAFKNVTSAYTLEISSNALLASFQGSFSSLEVDGDTVAIKSNPSLRSLTGLENLRAPTASFTITGNTLLANITALQGVGNCAAASPYNTVNVPVSVQVRLANNSTCTLSSWKGVCAYITTYKSSSGVVNSCPRS